MCKKNKNKQTNTGPLWSLSSHVGSAWSEEEEEGEKVYFHSLTHSLTHTGGSAAVTQLLINNVYPTVSLSRERNGEGKKNTHTHTTSCHKKCVCLV